VGQTRYNECGTVQTRDCPSAPVGTCGSFNSNPTNPATPMTYTWDIGTSLQVWDSTGHWWYNAGASSPKTIGIILGRIIYSRTTASNGVSITANDTCPLPPNPPAATINGKLQQKSGTGCYVTSAGNTISASSFNLTTSNNDVCVHLSNPDCTAADGINYTCTINFNSNSCLSQSPPTWPTSVDVTLNSAVAAGYGFYGWTTPLSCSSPQNTISSVDAGSSTTRALTFDFSGINWYKLRNASFIGSSTAGITVPAIVNQYITGDSDDDVSKYFIIGNAGPVLNATVLPGTSYSSPNNWHITSYNRTLIFNPLAFSNYIRARKNYEQLASFDEISSKGDGIYLINGPVSINNTKMGYLANKKIVLIVTGNVSFDSDIASDIFNPANASVALVATGQGNSGRMAYRPFHL